MQQKDHVLRRKTCFALQVSTAGRQVENLFHGAVITGAAFQWAAGGKDRVAAVRESERQSRSASESKRARTQRVLRSTPMGLSKLVSELRAAIDE